MELVDRAVYFVPAGAADAAIRRLQALDVPARGWRDKISVAWLLEGGSPVVPVVPNLRDLACRDFKIAETPPQLPWGRSLANGLERLVHDLRGVRIGVALGGGAARGMSHLGVLKALEQNGIVVDMIAGTSAGAMTGIMYSAGLDPDYNARSVRRPTFAPRGSFATCRGATTGTSCTSTAAGTSTRCSANTSTTGGSNNSPSPASPSPSTWWAATP